MPSLLAPARLLALPLLLACLASAGCSAGATQAELEPVGEGLSSAVSPEEGAPSDEAALAEEAASSDAAPDVAGDGIEPLGAGREDRCCLLKDGSGATLYCKTQPNMFKVRANNRCRTLRTLWATSDSVVRGGTCEGSWAQRCYGKYLP